MLQALKLDKVSRFAKDLSVLFNIPGLKQKNNRSIKKQEVS